MCLLTWPYVAAGDLVLEYMGSLVRPVVADLLEARQYNQMVGAGKGKM